MKEHLLRLSAVVCFICGVVFLQGELTVESLASAFDNTVDEVQYASAMSIVEAIDGGGPANVSTPIATGVVGEELQEGKGRHGAPVGFPGVVIPNPANITPLTDTEALPSTRLAYGARFSTKSYAGHREGNIESGRQMWPDVQRREQ